MADLKTLANKVLSRRNGVPGAKTEPPASETAGTQSDPDNSCFICGRGVDRTGIGWGAWTDGKTVFGATVHVRCFNLKFPDGPRENRPADDDPEREASTVLI